MPVKGGKHEDRLHAFRWKRHELLGTHRFAALTERARGAQMLGKDGRTKALRTMGPPTGTKTIYPRRKRNIANHHHTCYRTSNTFSSPQTHPKIREPGYQNDLRYRECSPSRMFSPNTYTRPINAYTHPASGVISVCLFSSLSCPCSFEDISFYSTN